MSQPTLDTLLQLILDPERHQTEDERKTFEMADSIAAQALISSGECKRVSEALLVASLLVHWSTIKPGRIAERIREVHARSQIIATSAFLNNVNRLLHMEAALPGNEEVVTGLAMTKTGSIHRANGFQVNQPKIEDIEAWAKELQVESDRMFKVLEAEAALHDMEPPTTAH